MPEVSIERLREIEWAGDNYDCECCPVCGGLNPAEISELVLTGREQRVMETLYGHQEGCWLGELLRATAFAVKGAG